MAEPWIIVGLGNPGAQYAHTRHNVGYGVADVLAGRIGSRFTRHKTRAFVAEGRLGVTAQGAPGPRVVIAMTGTYMNVSGPVVGALLKFYGVGPENLLVVHDELDLPPQTLRLKMGGGEGGHNGLKSISQTLGTKEYLRLRLGIGRPPGRQDPADYVLRDVPVSERADLCVALEEAADAVEEVLLLGLATAQQHLHTA